MFVKDGAIDIGPSPASGDRVMRNTARLFAACSALALLPLSGAIAADYNYSPPIFVEEAPEWVPVEIGSGWYLRGDVSYNLNDPVYDFAILGRDVTHRRLGGSLGVGYHFSDLLRGDINIGYTGGDRFNYNDLVNSASLSHTMWTGIANTYLDLGTVAGITPYVGAGAGLLYSRHNVDINAPSLGIDFDAMDEQYHFAYTLNAGAAYKVAPNTSVDLGYQFMHSPKAEYINTDSLTVEEGIKQHQIRLGLRYNLW
jgi:opacity protein-like surface antigen